MSFAVIDFETTGLVPERTDRVVEVGVVLTDDDGCIELEWTTLVNPHRDVGASHIHGIPAGDVLDAPDFADISDYLLEMIGGRAVVAHNASFDMRFLHRELQLARYDVPTRPIALCSMKWAGRMMGAAKLSHCCEALGIALTNAHSALGDAHATAELLPTSSKAIAFPEIGVPTLSAAPPSAGPPRWGERHGPSPSTADSPWQTPTPGFGRCCERRGSPGHPRTRLRTW